MPDYGPILFVDDEAPMRQAVTQWLGLAGFETLVHAKASTALDTLSMDFPGILVTDLKMEGMDGIEVVRQLKAWDDKVVIMIVTAFGTIEAAVQAMQAGAANFGCRCGRDR